MDRSNFTAELCQHRNNTVAVPGFSCPNPLTRPSDTETDSNPDPDLASPLTFSQPALSIPIRKFSRRGAEAFSSWLGGRVNAQTPAF
ncbi:MAG: hypothetical protein PHF14_02160 [Verrucomicrobiota bacterium]|nr:hypothetical protein [Verrucomicrobiota bacterium]